MRKYFHKFFAAIKSVFVYKNFLLFWKNYLDFYKDDYLIIELRNGVRYKIRSKKISIADSYIFNETWLYGVHRGIKSIIREAKIGIDIGAHIGAFSVFAAFVNPSLKIYAYEPAPDNFKLLKKNINLNKFGNRIIPNEIAIVGDNGKTRELYLTGKEHGLYTIDRDYLEAIKSYDFHGAVKTIGVKTRTLKDVFSDCGIKFCAFLKIDCEGAEYEILFNTPPEILRKIKAMSVEYHSGHQVEELKKFLENSGFLVSFPHRRLDVLLALNENTLLRA